jgi:uncharacterized membrane protein
MMWSDYDGWGHGSDVGGWFMFLGMVLVTIAIIFVVVYLIRMSSGTTTTHGSGAAPTIGALPQVPPPPQTPAESPRDIVKRRYAAGEIDRDTYVRMLDDL